MLIKGHDEEFKHLGSDSVQKAFELLESNNWKVEKITSASDTIATQANKIGKVYKLTAKVNYAPKKLLKELFYEIENVPSWNPTLLESKIIRKIDGCTDIVYSVSASGGGGMVKSRDFVNLRCWKLFKNSRVVENYNINTSLSKLSLKTHSSDGDNEDESSNDESDVKKKKENSVRITNEKSLKKSASDNVINENHEDANTSSVQLSKSLGTKEVKYTSDDDETFSDAQVEVDNNKNNSGSNSNNNDLDKCVFVSAAISIEYPLYPPTTKYIRGDNIISCWAIRHDAVEVDSCTFEWLLCIDLKGSLPKYVLNTAFVSLMTDYMVHLRARIEHLNKENINV